LIPVDDGRVFGDLSGRLAFKLAVFGIVRWFVKDEPITGLFLKQIAIRRGTQWNASFIKPRCISIEFIHKAETWRWGICGHR
jgi:hypothetical protein